VTQKARLNSQKPHDNPPAGSVSNSKIRFLPLALIPLCFHRIHHHALLTGARVTGCGAPSP